MSESANKTNQQNVDAIIALIEALRGENGCPWDKKQTPVSIGTYVLEEVYELLEAIEEGVPNEICEELGDVLFLLLFLVDIFQEQEKFDLKEVVRRNADKMIRRHPHVFGESKVKDAEAVKAQWYRIKKTEKPDQQERSILDGIPRALPALLRAYRMLERIEKIGFGWRNTSNTLKMTEGMWTPFKEAIDTGATESRIDFGNLFFALAALGRCIKVNPESAMISVMDKFEQRFRQMEVRLAQEGKELELLSRDEKQKLWGQIAQDFKFESIP